MFAPFALGPVTLKNRCVRAAAFGGAGFDELIRTHVEVGGSFPCW